MFNVGGPELLVILFIALIVLGPDKLPEAARKLGQMRGEIRKVTHGFKQEMRTAMDVSSEHQARERGHALTRTANPAAGDDQATPDAAPVDTTSDPTPAVEPGRVGVPDEATTAGEAGPGNSPGAPTT